MLAINGTRAPQPHSKMYDTIIRIVCPKAKWLLSKIPLDVCLIVRHARIQTVAKRVSLDLVLLVGHVSNVAAVARHARQRQIAHHVNSGTSFTMVIVIYVTTIVKIALKRKHIEHMSIAASALALFMNSRKNDFAIMNVLQDIPK